MAKLNIAVDTLKTGEKGKNRDTPENVLRYGGRKRWIYMALRKKNLKKVEKRPKKILKNYCNPGKCDV